MKANPDVRNRKLKDFIFACVALLLLFFSLLTLVALIVDLAATGMILLGMTLAMNAVAIYIRHRFRKRIKW